MATIRFFTDEDVYGAVYVQLRAAGFDVMSTPDANRLAQSDESQLAWAAQEDRTLVTFNIADFARLHQVWMDTSRHHAGIIVSAQRSIGGTVRSLLNLANTLCAEEMRDRLEYLSSW